MHFGNKNGEFPPSPSPFSVTFHKETTSSSSSSSRISPAVLFIIVTVTALFFISCFLHFLVKFIKNHSSSSSAESTRYPDGSSSDSLQRQLQQLFHLHDSGLDQAFIDALPVFVYKEIIGLKQPFDCAVCLCEFSDKDKLRWLPTCSHAFHLNCIDTWLLSNSSCPLCRGTLFSPGFSTQNPIFDFDDPIEEDEFSNHGGNGLSSNQKKVEIDEVVVEKRGFSVRLGKFKKLQEDSGETSSSSLDARRCYSMGSYQYLEAETNLRVPFNHKKNHGMAAKRVIDCELEGKKINIGAKRDSFSVSKIWQWPKKAGIANSIVTSSSILSPV
jgi:hypothetical protein